jgi:exopolyphosphatase / guanosine-5'-triphosphate,3'-diphosphate pyrophosphatase
VRFDREELRALHERIIRSKVADRRRMPGLDEKRAELLPAGSMLLLNALDLFDVQQVTISDWALREGIVLDAVVTHDPDDWSDDPRALRRASISNLARRCNSDVEHTAHVTRLALRLFDETESLHALGPGDREMLEYASMIHDIGQHVSPKGHHRHAAYLVESAQLRGFDPTEVAFLAALVRHHRKGDPKPSEPRYAALSEPDRARLRKLAALLRVADGLDRGRRGVVDDLTADIGADLVILRLRVRGDAELSLWGARRRRELFEDVFGREIEFSVVATQNV